MNFYQIFQFFFNFFSIFIKFFNFFSIFFQFLSNFSIFIKFFNFFSIFFQFLSNFSIFIKFFNFFSILFIWEKAVRECTLYGKNNQCWVLNNRERQLVISIVFKEGMRLFLWWRINSCWVLMTKARWMALSRKNVVQFLRNFVSYVTRWFLLTWIVYSWRQCNR